MSLSAREKFIKNDLFDQANKANDLLLTHSMLKEQIIEYSNYIKLIKEIFPFFNINDNKEELIKTIKKEIQKIKEKLQIPNNNLKIETKKLSSNYYRKLEQNIHFLYPLYHILDKEREDNFILENTLKTKDAFLKIFTNNLNRFKEYYNEFEENIRERYLVYNRKIKKEHSKELEKLQDLLNDYSKQLNQYNIYNSNLELECKRLKKLLSENSNSIRLNTENYYYYKNKLDIEEEINDSLIFKEFEGDLNISDSLSFSEDESYINYDLDLNFNVVNTTQTINYNKYNLNKIKLPLFKERLYTSDYKEQEFEIPKLNLKQIEFNKIRVVTEDSDVDDNEEIKNKEINKMIKMKKNIEKQKKKKEKYKNLISNFKLHYSKMKLYIKKISLSINNENIKSRRKTDELLKD